jgi:hypothetical protein
MPWGVAASIGGSLIMGAMSGGSGSSSSGSNSNTSVYDPYASYRPAAAQKLQTLMNNPGSAANTSYGQAMSQAASREMAAQGYTGSGNAIVAAANAGGTAYQQEFNNLVTLSGAGQSPASAQSAANQQADFQQQQNTQTAGQIGGLIGNIFGGSGSSGFGNSIGSLFGGTGGAADSLNNADLGGFGTSMDF